MDINEAKVKLGELKIAAYDTLYVIELNQAALRDLTAQINDLTRAIKEAEATIINQQPKSLTPIG